MLFSLLQLDTSQLRAIARSRVPSGFAARVEIDALPPGFVAARALKMRSEGQLALWAGAFLIVRQADHRIVGGCGFKHAPRNGRVEIGYGVSSACRNEGAATAAVGLLVQAAREGGALEVLAEISPDNHASTAVVKKAGFAPAGARHDAGGEYVVQWLRQCRIA